MQTSGNRTGLVRMASVAKTPSTGKGYSRKRRTGTGRVTTSRTGLIGRKTGVRLPSAKKNAGDEFQDLDRFFRFL